jgi:DNA-binding XRE family transcriptional regulator
MGVRNQYADFEFDNVGPPILDAQRKELQMNVSSVTRTGALPQHRRIRALRRQLEVSQLEVAQYAGISQSQYSLFEQGYVRLPLEIIQEIEALLHQAACRENGNG